MKVDGSDKDTKGKSVARSPVQSLKELLNSDYVKNRFLEVMGAKASAFLASVLNAAQKNPDIAQCEQNSLLSSAMVAATLDLPIDSNLGFAAIVPYKTKIKNKATGEEYWVTLAQFQIMYKGFIQLALRSGQYKTINVSPIYDDEFESYDIITGDIIIKPVANGFREQERLDKIIGYVAFFRLINGFERIEYWSLNKIIAHGKRFSKSYKNPNGLWSKDPHAMYAKTVLKNTISKWGILSVTMQTAIVTDQAVIKDYTKPLDGDNVDYVDNVPEGGDTVEFSVVSEGDEEEPAEESDAEKTAGEDETVEPGATPGNPEEVKLNPPTPPPKNKGKPQSNLFPRDEAEALEELYERKNSGVAGPDFV